MRLTTIRTPSGTRAARVEGEDLVVLAARDVGEVLALPENERDRIAEEGSVASADADFAPLVVDPSKVVCVGLNYRNHILETGRDLPAYPTLFAKFTECLLGPYDDLVLPRESSRPDWEAELAIVIGKKTRRVSEADALDAIAGYSVLNDVSMRDWQNRTVEWLQGKTFEATTPVGPVLVTPEEIDHAADLEIRTEVDGEVMQINRTSELVFGPAMLVSYISQIITLQPGDLIATGTPGGVGNARDPQIYLEPGQLLRTVIEGIGECRNPCVKDG